MNSRMKDTITLGVDGNWVLHRAFSTQGQRADVSAAIKRVFVSMICKDALFVKATRILVGFDGARIFRYKVYSGYKANRGSSDGESPYDYLEGVCEYLEYLGIPYLQNHKYEADDVVCSVAHQTVGPVVISTKDKDSYQFVNSRVRLLDSTNKPEPRITTEADVVTRFGVSARQCLAFQTLVGDPMDNVPELMRKADAKKGLKRWGSIKNWAKNDKSFAAFVRDNKEALKINRELVRLVPDLNLPDTVVTWNKTAKDVPDSYIRLRDFANPKSRGLF